MGHLASLSGAQVCTEDFWREFAFYLTFLHKSSGMHARLDGSTIRGYLQMAFGAAEQLLGGREGETGHRAFFQEVRGSGWLSALGAEAQRQQRAQVRLEGAGGRVSEREREMGERERKAGGVDDVGLLCISCLFEAYCAKATEAPSHCSTVNPKPTTCTRIFFISTIVGTTLSHPPLSRLPESARMSALGGELLP